MTRVAHEDLVKKQFQELQTKHQYLQLHDTGKGYTISGHLTFRSEYAGIEIQDGFSIFIEIPARYPDAIPTVKEMAGRIPNNFHKFDNDVLCLGTPTDQWIKFNQSKTLLGFIENLVVPHLFSFCFKEKTGRMPFGERSHGGLGILEFYCEYFELKDFEAARKLLKLLATGSYRREKTCPCGSGRRLRSCHGKKFLEAMKSQEVSTFKGEYKQALSLGTKKPRN